MELEYSDKIILARALKNLEEAQGVIKFLSSHFRDKYNLVPGMEITPDGRITSLERNDSGGLQREDANDQLLRSLQDQLAVSGDTRTG